MHGPFIGIEYAHADHLIRSAVEKRLDMTFEVATNLGVSRVVLHSGFKTEMDLFKLHDYWLNRNCAFWKTEIVRWANAKINVVLENETEKSPDLLIKLIDNIDNPFLGLCFDIGHQNLFSSQSVSTWVQAMGHCLHHVHLHDNDKKADRHWPIGKGNIDFTSFYESLEKHSPHATISLEVDDTIEIKMQDLRILNKRFFG